MREKEVKVSIRGTEFSWELPADEWKMLLADLEKTELRGIEPIGVPAVRFFLKTAKKASRLEVEFF